MNWYIGQEIVAVRDHKDGLFNEGATFTIVSLRGGVCKCASVLIDIGIGRADKQNCFACNSKVIDTHGVRFFRETYFAPLDTLCNISELTEHLENTTAFEQ